MDFIAALSSPAPTVSDTRAQARKAFEDAKAALLVCVKTAPDDREQLEEEKAMWCREWGSKLDILSITARHCEGLSIACEFTDSERMAIEEARQTFQAYSAPKMLTVRDEVRNENTAGSADSGQSISATSPGLVPTGDVVPPLTRVEVVVPRKRARHEADDDGVGNQEATALEPGHFAHPESCTACVRKGTVCIGQPGHTCEPCKRRKSQCRYSRPKAPARSSTRVAATTRAAAKDNKSPAAARSSSLEESAQAVEQKVTTVDRSKARTASRKVAITIDDDDDDDVLVPRRQLGEWADAILEGEAQVRKTQVRVAEAQERMAAVEGGLAASAARLAQARGTIRWYL